jgi:hypothetical protein
MKLNEQEVLGTSFEVFINLLTQLRVKLNGFPKIKSN